MREIPFGGQMDEADFRSIQALAGRRIYAIMVLAWVALVAVALASGGWSTLALEPREILSTWLPIALMLPVFFVLHRFVVKRHWRHAKLLREPVSGAASESGITWNLAEISSNYFRWEMFVKSRMSDSLVLIYQSLNQVLYFPRRFFASDADWAEFRRLVTAKIPKR